MPSTKTKSVWETLSAIDCSGHTEEKNGFTYLAWSWAWQTLKEHYPTARFEKLPVVYNTDGTAMLSVRVWIDDIEDVTEVFPVINYSNKAIPNPNAFEINTAYQRALVKCLAYMGLGMYIFHGLGAVNPDTPVEYAVEDSEGKTQKTTDLTLVADILMTFMDGNAVTLDSLRAYWASNKQPLDHLKEFDSKLYDMVFNKFMEKAGELKQDG